MTERVNKYVAHQPKETDWKNLVSIAKEGLELPEDKKEEKTIKEKYSEDEKLNKSRPIWIRHPDDSLSSRRGRVDQSVSQIFRQS